MFDLITQSYSAIMLIATRYLVIYAMNMSRLHRNMLMVCSIIHEIIFQIILIFGVW